MRIKWQPIFTARTPTLFQWYIFKGEQSKYFRDVLGLEVAYTNGKNVHDEIYYDLNELLRMEKELSVQIKANPEFINKYISTCYKKCNHLLATSRKFGKTHSLKLLKNRDLLAWYKYYQHAVFEIMPFMTTPMVIDKILKKSIVALFEKDLSICNKNEQDVLLSKLIIPLRKNYFVKEQDSLLKMAIKLQGNKDVDISRDINKHLSQYAWTSTNVYLGRLQTELDVIRKIRKLLSKNPKGLLVKSKLDKKQAIKDYNEAFSQVKKCEGIENLINLSRQFLFLQTHKMEVLYLAHYYISPFLKEIGRRSGLTLDELIYLTGDEIISTLTNNTYVNDKELKERIKSVSIIKEHNKMSIFSGDKISKQPKMLVDVTVVRGMVASRGKTTGRAKLLFEVEDMAKIKKGDIIISPMTRPHFVPAMKKAAGIVTDFGGMLCHAALISREFGIPCVVGTEKATKAFKDGDIIELDAYKGVVRKIV